MVNIIINNLAEIEKLIKRKTNKNKNTTLLEDEFEATNP